MAEDGGAETMATTTAGASSAASREQAGAAAPVTFQDASAPSTEDLTPSSPEVKQSQAADTKSSSDAARSAADHSGSSNSGGGGGNFECNICLDSPHDPVVTLCGHLFCWACLYRWLQVHSHSKECPVCKAGVSEDKVVPLYGRGQASNDPRRRPVSGGGGEGAGASDIPNRPAGQRSEPVRQARQDPGFGFHTGTGAAFSTAFGGFTFSAGVGLFPALFGWHMHAFPGMHHPGAIGHGFGSRTMGMGPAGVDPNQPLTAEQQQQQFLSRLLFALGTLVMLAIMFF